MKVLKNQSLAKRLQKHILEVINQNVAKQSRTGEIEQYGRGQCVRFEGVHIEKMKTSDKGLKKVMDLC